MNTTAEGFQEAMNKVATRVAQTIKEAAKNISPWVSLIPRKTAASDEKEWMFKTVESPKLCCAYASAEAVTAAVRSLRDGVLHSLQRWGRSEYSRMCKHKIIAGPVVGSEVRVSHLDDSLMAMIHASFDSNSAAIGACDIVDGKPRFLLVTGSYLDGSPRVFDGFKTEIENLPIRWAIEQDQWVEVMPYTPSGNSVRVNPEYESALFEEAHVFLPTVMEIHVPSEDPESYFGDIEWVCVKNNDPSDPNYNPEGMWGFFQAKLKLTAKPVFPEHGVVIRHLR